MDKLEVHLFGAFDAAVAGDALFFSTDKLRALLAYLLIEARPHRREVLSALFWPDLEPEKAATNLRLTLSRLRQSLAPLLTELAEDSFFKVTRTTVEIDRGSYCTVDALLFDDLLDSVDVHPHADVTRCATCSRRLQDAAQLYRGDLLSGLNLPDALEFDNWQQREQQGRHQRALLALDALVAHKMVVASWAEAERFAEQQLALEPWREETYRRLMAIRLELGDRNGALAVYERLLAVLARELGATPELETEALYRRIRSLSTSASPLMPPVLPAHNLPAQRLPFFGREDELRNLAALLIDPAYRLVTLMGIGGAGKTRLAQAVARRVLANFPDGVWFVPLAAIGGNNASTQSEVLFAIASAVGYRFSGLSSERDQVLAYLAGKRMLLLLDNFEQLSNISDLLADVLESTQDVKLLVTSRQRLLFHEEYIWRVDSLALPPPEAASIGDYSSVQLFVSRATQQGGDFQFDATNSAEVATVCRLTAGIPLAIELAASWIAHMEVAAIATSISRNIDFLQSSLRGLPARHSSIRAVFEGSWALLSEAEQRTLARVSVFRGSFAVDAAGAVAALAERDLLSLSVKSLVVPRDVGRYELHELLREYAGEKLAERPEWDMAGGEPARMLADAHSHYYLTTLEQMRPALGGPQAKELLLLLQADRGNINSAWEAAVMGRRWDTLLAGVVGFSYYLMIQSLFNEGLMLFGAAIEQASIAAEGEDDQQRRLALAALLFEDTLVLLILGRLDEGLEYSSRGIALLEDSDPATVWLRGLHNMSAIYRRMGRFNEAIEGGMREVALARAADLKSPLASALVDLGWNLSELGRFDEAFAVLSESLEIYQQEDNLRGQSVTLNTLGVLSRRRGDLTAAHNFYAQTLHVAERLEYRDATKVAYGNLGLVAEGRGQYDQALQYLTRALNLCRQDGDRWGEALSLSSIGLIYMHYGDYAQALVEVKSALLLAGEINTQQGQSLANEHLAKIYRLQGDYAASLDAVHRALAISSASNDRDTVGLTKLHHGLTRIDIGEPAAAIEILQEVVSLRREMQQQGLLIEATAALAEAYLDSGDVVAARRLIDEVVPNLSEERLASSNDRLRVYWGCYKVLLATGEPERARAILQSAWAIISAESAQIADESTRQRFLTAVSLNARIGALVRGYQGI